MVSRAVVQLEPLHVRARPLRRVRSGRLCKIFESLGCCPEIDVCSLSLCKKNKFEYPRIITKRSRASVDSCSELGNTFAGLKVVFRELSP